jgi:hypothetical protein
MSKKRQKAIAMTALSRRATRRAVQLFLYLRNKHVIKCAVPGWRGYCLTIFVNTI